MSSERKADAPTRGRRHVGDRSVPEAGAAPPCHGAPLVLALFILWLMWVAGNRLDGIYTRLRALEKHAEAPADD